MVSQLLAVSTSRPNKIQANTDSEAVNVTLLCHPINCQIFFGCFLYDIENYTVTCEPVSHYEGFTQRKKTAYRQCVLFQV